MIKSIIYTWVKITSTIRSWIDSALKDTHNHYSWFLPEKIGLLASFFLNLFYSGIKLKRNQRIELNQIPKDAIIVYINKFKSNFEYLFYYTRYKQEKLRFPEIGLEYRIFIWQPFSRILQIFFSHLDYFFQNRSLPDPYTSGYIRQELIKGRTAFLSLVEKKGFYRRFVKDKTDPIQYFIEIQKSTDRPIYLVPQLMFFSKKPQRSNQKVMDILFGPVSKPGLIRKLIILFKNPEKIFIEVSEPVNLKQFINQNKDQHTTNEHLSLILRRNLLLQISRHRQNITGPILKSKQELKESVLTRERLQEFMNNYAESHDIPIYKIHKEADEYLEEIAANYNINIIKALALIVKWLTNTMFEGITVNEDVLNKIKLMSLKGPLVLIPCHKSHIDYLILSYILYNNNMQCPHVAAGKNLSFWPLGPLFRGAGAFFIRRTFKGAVLYSRIFTEYIHKLLEEGYSLEFFIEGGRSRTGKLLPPKLGLLSILLNAYKNGACNDIIFAPVYIGYDRVLEESSYLNELEGGQKKSEALSQLIKARKFLKNRYGKIYIKFHEPISLNSLLIKDHYQFAGMTQKEQNAFCRNLGHRMTNAIDQNTVVTPHALVAGAILNQTASRFSFESLMSQVEMYINYIVYQKANLADTLLLNHRHAIETVIEDYVQNKFIQQVSGDKTAPSDETNYVINESKRPALEYYKNNCIIFFIPAANTALNILRKDSFQFSAGDIYSDYEFIQDLFKNEFANTIGRSPEFLVRNSLKAFIDEAAIVPHPILPDTYNITSAGYRKLKSFSMFLTSFLESYLITLNFFRESPDNSISPKDRLKKIESMGIRMYKNKAVERKEALSKINYINAVDFFLSNGVKKADPIERIDTYAKKIQNYLNVLRT